MVSGLEAGHRPGLEAGPGPGIALQLLPVAQTSLQGCECVRGPRAGWTPARCSLCGLGGGGRGFSPGV